MSKKEEYPTYEGTIIVEHDRFVLVGSCGEGMLSTAADVAAVLLNGRKCAGLFTDIPWANAKKAIAYAVFTVCDRGPNVDVTIVGAPMNDAGQKRLDELEAAIDKGRILKA